MVSEPRPLRADARRNHEALIARGRELFARGDEGVRFDDFAGLAGVGVGTLYRHFPTREALAVAVYQQEVATLCALAHQLQSTLPAGEALEAFLHAVVAHVGAHQRLARRLVALLGGAADQMAHAGQELERAVTGLVMAAAVAGAIRDDARSGAVLMALHGITAAQPHPEWRADADAVVTALIQGIRPPAESR